MSIQTALGLGCEKRLLVASQAFDKALSLNPQYKDAYLQKTVLYKNGLTNIVDVQQALFTLNRAQTDISVAYINIWQALLLKAAASGDFDLFIKQVK